jgi:MscS family membrane protein
MIIILSYFIGILLTLLLIHLGINYLYRRLEVKEQTKSSTCPKMILLRILHAPFKYLISIGILLVFVYTYLKNFITLPTLPLERLEQALCVIFLAWSFWIGLDEVQKHLRRTKGKDETTILLITRGGSVIIFISTILLLLPLLGIHVGGILAFGGLSGIVLGFGVKDFLANIFGGFLLTFDQPFHLGDWIYGIDGKIDGHIEDIGWRLTRLRLQDKRILYIPNSAFLTTLFVNASQMSHRRILQNIPIRYDDEDKLQVALTNLRKLFKETESLDPKQNNLITLTNLGSMGFELNLTVFTTITRDPYYREFVEQFLFKVYNILRKNGIKVAPPTQTIQLEKAVDSSSPIQVT